MQTEVCTIAGAANCGAVWHGPLGLIARPADGGYIRRSIPMI